MTQVITGKFSSAVSQHATISFSMYCMPLNKHPGPHESLFWDCCKNNPDMCMTQTYLRCYIYIYIYNHLS